MAKFVQKLRNWYGANPVPYPDKLYSAQDRVFFQTGEELIGRILRAIQLNQSVVLSGPRGCGKSKCIELAIARAEKEGIIPPQGWIKSQGNKEIPRDYLAEDGLTFRFTTDKDGEKVNPAKQKAPFFKFAVRDEQFQEPVRDPSTRRVDCQIRRPGDPSGVKRPVPRFIVFLDEINRFSDGVLDSLLTVLEERTVILAGDEYKLPVVVCMTMNPPGYDATARKLSPPLAARISRSYRLYTPDLDTLTDVIIRGKMREQAEYRFLFAFDMLRATKDVLDAVAKCRADLNPHLLESVSAAADYRDSVASLAASLNTRRKDGLLSFAGILPGLKKLLAELKSKLPLREDIVHLLKAAESEGELEKEANSLPSRLQECLDLLSQIIELEELFPNIEVALQRKVALVTLCLWGEPSERKPAASDPAEPQNADGSLVAEWRTAWNAGLRAFRRSAPSTETKPGHEYLTADTVDLLQRLADRNGALCRDMQTVGELCHYGPDGRAASDWLLTAIGLAVERRRLRDIAEHAGKLPPSFTRATLSVQDLTDTAIECLGLKIYDRFSSTSQPDLLFKKEQAVLSMARVVLAHPMFDSAVARIIDESAGADDEVSLLWKMTGGESPLKYCSAEDQEALRDIFVRSGVTADRHVLAWFRRIGPWLASRWNDSVPEKITVLDMENPGGRVEPIVVKDLAPTQGGGAPELLTLLTWDGDGTKILLEQSGNELAGFTHVRWRTLVEQMVKFHWQIERRLPNHSPRVCCELARIWEDIQGPVRALPIEELLLKYECARIIGGVEFGRACRNADRNAINAFASELDRLLWATGGEPSDNAAESMNSVEPLVLLQTNYFLLQDLLLLLRSQLISQRGKTAENLIVTIGWYLTFLDEAYNPLLLKRLGAAAKSFPEDSFRKLFGAYKLTKKDEWRLAEIAATIWPKNSVDHVAVQKAKERLGGDMGNAVEELVKALKKS